MRLFPALLVLLVLSALTGCASVTHTVGPGDDFADVNRALAGRPATVVLADGTAHEADAIRLAPDSTSWVNPQTGELHAVPTEAIVVVERRDHKRATGRVARRGAVVGAVAGAVLFGAAGYDSGGCFIFCSTPTPSERARGAVGFGIAGAGLGAISGLFYGTIIGIFSDPAERYEVLLERGPPADAPPHLPNVP